MKKRTSDSSRDRKDLAPISRLSRRLPKTVKRLLIPLRLLIPFFCFLYIIGWTLMWLGEEKRNHEETEKQY